jgi:hypothetical protein
MSKSLRTFGRLMAISANSAADGHFEVSYHALAGAMHAADDAHDSAALSVVADCCKERQAIVDARKPTHKMSTRSARERGNMPLFSSLGVSTGATRARLCAKALAALV